MNAWTLLVNLTLKSTLVLALAWTVAFVLRRRSAAARHIVWTAAFAALVALPLLSVTLPAWSHPFANAVLPSDSGITFHADSAATVGTSTGAPRIARQVTPAAPAGSAIDTRRILVWLWVAGAAMALLHMLTAYAAIWKLRRKALPSRHDPAQLGIDGGVALLESDGMPMTAGILRPAIFLPAESAGWSTDRVRVVVLHEFAHIVRGDAALQLLARAALCLQWFNPLAWMAWREFLKERERAADDLVLNSGARASDYATHLLEIARTLQPVPAGAAVGIAMARPSQLEGRLLAILDGRVPRAHHGRAALAMALLAAFALTAPLATVRAQSQAERQLPADLDSVIVTANIQKNHELLDQTAVDFEKLGKFAEAQKLREAALALRKEASKAAYAEGLVRLGDLARKRNANAEAIQYYLDAVAVGDMPQTVPALIDLGLNAALRDHNLAAGMEYLQRARNAAKAGKDIGRAMTWMAFLEQNDAAKVAEAESLYRTALALEDPGSGEQALTTELLARLLRAQDRGAEAETLEESARAMRKILAANLSTAFQSRVMITGLKVGNGVTAPKLIFKVEPAYSEEARAAKFQGTVLLKVVIDTDGRAKDVQVLKGLGLGLDEKAVEAINRWKFAPGEQAGVPVPVQAQIEVNFRLM